MGWYTTGPGEVQYKYGDVVAAARESGVGALSACPRIEMDDTAFFREEQRAALKRGLPWETLPYDADPTSEGDWIPVPRDVDAWNLLAFLAQTIAENAATLTELLGEGWDEDRLHASLDFEWLVEAEDYPALLAWLNAALPAPLLTLEALGRGQIDDYPWYEPPADLAEAFQQLAAEESPRHLVARMLGAAAVSGDALHLYQPGDDYQQEVEREEATEPAAALLFRPADHPFADRLAAAFGVPDAVRAMPFYVCRPGLDVDLPPEETDTPAEDLATGTAFIRAFAGLLSTLDPFTLVVPEGEEDAPRRMRFGWHPDAPEEALREAFFDAGLVPVGLGEFIEGSRERFEGRGAEERLADLAGMGDEGTMAGMGYLVGGGEPPERVGMAAVVVWLLAFPEVDLAVGETERMEELLRRFAAGFSS